MVVFTVTSLLQFGSFVVAFIILTSWCLKRIRIIFELGCQWQPMLALLVINNILFGIWAESFHWFCRLPFIPFTWTGFKHFKHTWGGRLATELRHLNLKFEKYIYDKKVVILNMSAKPAQQCFQMRHITKQAVFLFTTVQWMTIRSIDFYDIFYNFSLKNDELHNHLTFLHVSRSQ